MTVEILAPAGSFESARAAVNAGADAVYMGGSRFGARAGAESTEENRGIETLDFVHLHEKKMYLTVNTLMKEQELEQLPAFLLPYAEHGLDAVIVQDFGAWRLIRECFPDLPVHISTQMTLTGSWGAKWMESEGASRVVLSRELSLKEIKQIRQAVSIEIEVFVHGALCYCYSGQCLFSSMLGGRSGNRGRCAQPCRLPYTREPGHQKQYLMNCKDLCTVQDIPRLIQAGIDSMKIEGRMKSPVYTAGVTGIYRKYVDRYLERGEEHFYVEPEDLRILSELFDRGGSTSYLWKHNGKEMIAPEEKTFRAVDQDVIRFIESKCITTDLKIKIDGIVTLKIGKPAKIAVCRKDIFCEWEGAAVQRAEKSPLTEETVQRQMRKTGGTPFEFVNLEIELEENCFVSIQALNELRRQGLEMLKQTIEKKHSNVLKAENTKPVCHSVPERQNAQECQTVPEPKLRTPRPKITVLLPDFSSVRWGADLPGVDRLIVDEAQADHLEELEEMAFLVHSRGKQLLYRMPSVLRSTDTERLRKSRRLLETAGLDGIMIKNAEEAGLVCLDGFDLPVALDYSLYSWNRQAVLFLKEALGSRFFYETLPLELNERELCCRGCQGAELLSYGHIPLMVTAGCLAKNTSGCSHKEQILFIRDRKGKKFPVKTVCKGCYNVIYNGVPLDLSDQWQSVEALHPGSIRLEFSVESEEERERLIKQIFTTIENGGSGSLPAEFTRGHFKRGVD